MRKQGATILGPLDMTIEASGLTMVIGPNGSGKTTLLKLIHGLERPRSGSIKWSMEKQEAQKRQAFVFQTPVMLRRNVLANVVYPLRVQGFSLKEAETKAIFWLQQIGLADAKHLDAKMLSGGERQKLALARALALEPEILFLDEPTANLDGQSTREIETLIREAVARDVKVVMTTHNIGQAKRLANEVVFLHKGVINERAEAPSFFQKASTSQARAFVAGDIVE